MHKSGTVVIATLPRERLYWPADSAVGDWAGVFCQPNSRLNLRYFCSFFPRCEGIDGSGCACPDKYLTLCIVGRAFRPELRQYRAAEKRAKIQIAEWHRTSEPDRFLTGERGVDAGARFRDGQKMRSVVRVRCIFCLRMDDTLERGTRHHGWRQA